MINIITYTPLSAVIFLFVGILLLLVGLRTLSAAHGSPSAGVLMPVGSIMLGVGVTVTIFVAVLGFNQLIEAPFAFIRWSADFIYN